MILCWDEGIPHESLQTQVTERCRDIFITQRSIFNTIAFECATRLSRRALEIVVAPVTVGNLSIVHLLAYRQLSNHTHVRWLVGIAAVGFSRGPVIG